MLISLDNDEYIIAYTAITIFTLIVKGEADFIATPDNGLDIDSLEKINDSINEILEESPNKLENLLKKLSLVGEISADFSDKNNLC